MDKEKKEKKEAGPTKQKADGPVAASHCKTQGCKKTPARDVFCNEHFLWFKAGLVRKDGSFPKDFEQKYIQFVKKAA